MIVVLTLLLLLFLGVVVIDRIGSSYAEGVLAEKVSQQVADQGATSGTPEVEIAGVPFLTQVLAGKYQEIRISLPDFSAPTGTDVTVRMDSLDIRATDVSAPLSALRDGTGDVRAETVTGTGTIDYDVIADATGQPGLTLAEKDGRVVGTAELKISGLQTVELAGTADLSVAKGKVQVRFSDVTAKDVAPNPFVQGQIDSYVKRMTFTVDVPDLPMNLQVQELTPLPEGLRVTFGASDVALAGAGA
ncbi:hypothetical protein FHR83_004668 [Actinoplanes campanulatus]|uniref:DUF2993 domain-containing protein n=1 Tax=Actinoplanes campanulatus TaxID=113559 RepID=A0A7W5AIN6_9ACTN|nr:DUF2993 domain-containing protein [Actinoplanes campanulatus]MBB3096993.1 hypothetical protein [Actinoplanes campanulatus]GGN14944.1 hypothetical protein GCM10010109_26530 [Actinoplanes campanulatus]GID37824.1 hypothetical protein Aca09nite_43300 [Actinoplanes campanulatus]